MPARSGWNPGKTLPLPRCHRQDIRHNNDVEFRFCSSAPARMTGSKLETQKPDQRVACLDTDGSSANRGGKSIICWTTGSPNRVKRLAGAKGSFTTARGSAAASDTRHRLTTQVSSLTHVTSRSGRSWGFQPQREHEHCCGWKPQPRVDCQLDYVPNRPR